MHVAVIGQDIGIEQFVRSWDHVVDVYADVFPAAEARLVYDLVVFTGGEDVSPCLYNQPNVASNNNMRRDLQEMIWFHKFYNTPKLGICRGGQFLNVMSGGTMLQDIPGHALAGKHECTVVGRIEPYVVTSTHHQGMVQSDYGAVYAFQAMPDVHNRISECIFYATTKSLCFQPHPEYEREGLQKGNTVDLLKNIMKVVHFPRLIP